MKLYGWGMRILCIAFVVSMGLYIWKWSQFNLILAGVVFVVGMIIYGINNEPQDSVKSASIVLMSLFWPAIIVLHWFAFDSKPEFIGLCHLCNGHLRRVEVTTFLCPDSNTCIDDTETIFEEVKYCPKCEQKPKKANVLCINSKCLNFTDCVYGQSGTRKAESKKEGE